MSGITPSSLGPPRTGPSGSAESLSQRLRRLAPPVLGAVVLSNLLFLVVVLMAPGDPQVVADRIQTAFANGDLTEADYLPWDSQRGWNQYDDCVVLQMLSNPGSSRLERALAPRVQTVAGGGISQCGLLRARIVDGAIPDAPAAFYYARYWHGYNAVASYGLRALDLGQLRLGLSASVWVAVAALALTTLRAGRHVQRTAGVIAITAASVWAVPFFAPGLTHGPGDAALIGALAGLAAWRRLAGHLAALAAYAAAFGATVIFLGTLTGQLPIALAWLMALSLAAARDQGRPGIPAAMTAAMAFSFAAVSTVIAKQLIGLVVVAPDAAQQFAASLTHYASLPDFEPGWPGILEPFGRLFVKSSTLAFGNAPAGYALVGLAVIAWAAAIARGWRSRHSLAGRDVLLVAGAAAVPAAWVTLLPTHTYIHAVLVVRMLVVPISLAPLALLWPDALNEPLSVGSRHWGAARSTPHVPEGVHASPCDPGESVAR